MISSKPLTPDALARRPLVFAALEGAVPIAGKRFSPGATITVGSNSKNDVVVPEKFELTSYKLISRGSLLHVVPPLHVQASVWIDDQVHELKGYVRDLRKRFPTLPETLALASERFIVRYATGIVLIGRFADESEEGGEPGSEPNGSDAIH